MARTKQDDPPLMRATEKFSMAVLSSMYWNDHSPRVFARLTLDDDSDGAVHVVNCVLRRRAMPGTGANVARLLRLSAALGIDAAAERIYEGVRS